METNQHEYIGAFNPQDARIIFENFRTEDIEHIVTDDQSVQMGNSPFEQSPGRSSKREICKIFVHNRDLRRAIEICEELFGVSPG